MVHLNHIVFSIAIVLCVLILVLIFMTKSSKIHKGNPSKKMRAHLVNNESNCEFVSSRGLLKLWDISPPSPPSSDQKEVYDYNWKKVKPYSIVYLTGSSIHSFIKKSLPNITVPFVLVSGDSDASIPIHVLTREEFNKFINDPRVVHWFAQNLVVKHPKVSIIPIGLDYHTLTQGNRPSWGPSATPLEQEALLKLTRKESLPLAQRQLKCYSNFHFLMTTHYGQDRVEAVEKIPKHLVYYEPHNTTRLECWKHQIKYAFVISPNGNGYDCHRTWEALCLGCIPVIKRCPISTLNLFEGLPVLLVDDWSDLNLDLLKQTVSFVAENTWNLQKLNLNYWKQQIMEYKYKFIE